MGLGWVSYLFAEQGDTIVSGLLLLVLDMGFPDRVVRLRKERGWTQQELADKVGFKVLQIRRYENGTSQLTLEVIKNLAIGLGVTSDTLIFDADERGPSDDLKLQFEAVSKFDEEDRKIAKALLESLILKYNAKQAFVDEMKEATK